MKETLLKDIKIDFEQLKCLVNSLNTDHNPILYEAVKRNISQLQNRLKELNNTITSLSIDIDSSLTNKKNQEEIEETKEFILTPEKEEKEQIQLENFPQEEEEITEEKEEFVLTPENEDELKEEELPHEEELTEEFQIEEEEVTSEFEIEEESILEDNSIVVNIIEAEEKEFAGNNIEEQPTEIEKEQKNVFIPTSETNYSSIREFITLNDKFRFTRELFDDDSEKMMLAVNEIDATTSLEDALHYIATILEVDEENEAYMDFIEITRKRFNA